jgi:energy-coupling factor transporter ATP-binding protein EcfA2
MPHVDLTLRSDVPSTFRVSRVQGMFDLPAHATQEVRIEVDVPLEQAGDWHVGAIVGASGTGKTTVARSVFDQVWMTQDLQWNLRPIIDDFPKGISVDDIVSSLVSVGFSSAPAYLRPFAVLSLGEQSRASLARLMLENHDTLVVDEFTSVVDRTVARAVSTAVGRAVRQKGSRFVAVTCHKDVIPWLAPDWVLDMDDRRFLLWHSPGRRPGIRLRIYPGGLEAWPRFGGYHYMTAGIHRSARVFLATVEFPDDPGTERACGFFSVLPLAGYTGWSRGHRTVVLPDFQGLGIGNKMIELTAEWLWQNEHRRFSATTSAPGIVRHRLHHPEMWKMTMAPQMKPVPGKTGVMAKSRTSTSAGRLTTSWSYLPVSMRALVDDLEGNSHERVDVRVDRTHKLSAR